MDFLWNAYEFRILKNMDYGMDMDSVLNPSGPTVCKQLWLCIIDSRMYANTLHMIL